MSDSVRLQCPECGRVVLSRGARPNRKRACPACRRNVQFAPPKVHAKVRDNLARARTEELDAPVIAVAGTLSIPEDQSPDPDWSGSKPVPVQPDSVGPVDLERTSDAEVTDWMIRVGWLTRGLQVTALLLAASALFLIMRLSAAESSYELLHKIAWPLLPCLAGAVLCWAIAQCLSPMARLWARQVLATERQR